MWVIIRPVSDVWKCLYFVNSLFDTAKQLPNRERNANVFKDPSFWQRERGHRSGFLWLFPRNLVASKCEFRPCKTWFTGLLRCESWHGNEQLHWPWYISSQQAQPRHCTQLTVAWRAYGELMVSWPWPGAVLSDACSRGHCWSYLLSPYQPRLQDLAHHLLICPDRLWVI